LFSLWYMVVVKFLVFVSEVVSIFSKILTWIIGGGGKRIPLPHQLNYWGDACPGCPPLSLRLWSRRQSMQLETKNDYRCWKRLKHKTTFTCFDHFTTILTGSRGVWFGLDGRRIVLASGHLQLSTVMLIRSWRWRWGRPWPFYTLQKSL